MGRGICFDWESHPEETERLKAMWSAGNTASQIATALGHGITRNAIIGRVHRLKLSGHTQPSKPKVVTMTKPKPKPAPPEAPPPAIPTDTFAGNGQCKHIQGDPIVAGWQMCGNAVVPGKQWCPYHNGIVFDPVRNAQRRSG